MYELQKCQEMFGNTYNSCLKGIRNADSKCRAVLGTLFGKKKRKRRDSINIFNKPMSALDKFLLKSLHQETK